MSVPGPRALAVIVAGGASLRFGASVPKQFVPVLGVPLLAHTVRNFSRCDAVSRIVVVLPREGFSEARSSMSPHVDRERVGFVPGGPTRQDSVWCGLRQLEASASDLIAVHDGARPCALPDLIARVVRAAAESGGAIAAVPVVETLKRATDRATVEHTVDRGGLYRAQTPQCFRWDVLKRAFENAFRQGFEGTDEAALVEREGATIRLVEGSERNVKVTTTEDLALVTHFLSLERS